MAFTERKVYHIEVWYLHMIIMISKLFNIIDQIKDKLRGWLGVIEVRFRIEEYFSNVMINTHNHIYLISTF